MELRTTRIFERFSTTVSKNKQRYVESDPTQADLHALGTSWAEPQLRSACNDDVISQKTKVCDSWNFEKSNVSPN